MMSEKLMGTHQVTDDIESEIVEPVQGVDVGVVLSGACGSRRQSIPLFDELIQVVMHVLLKLADGLGAEGVRHGFPLPSMLRSISSGENSTLDAYEGIVVVTDHVSTKSVHINRRGLRLRGLTSSETQFHAHKQREWRLRPQ